MSNPVNVREAELTATYSQTLNKSKHGKHKPDYYAKNKVKFLLAQKRYRTKLKADKSTKSLSEFQQKNKTVF